MRRNQRLGTQKRGARLVATALVAAWGLVVLACASLLGAYNASPAAEASAPPRWPAATTLARTAGRATLVVVMHPKCPCTSATLAELERLLARAPSKPRVHALFVRPAGVPVGWEETALVERARSIHALEVRIDVDGTESRRFGSLASGHALLFDADGVLRFSGGLTDARGHEGPSAGQERLLEALARDAGADAATAPVFGCALDSSDAGAQQ